MGKKNDHGDHGDGSYSPLPLDSCPPADKKCTLGYLVFIGGRVMPELVWQPVWQLESGNWAGAGAGAVHPKRTWVRRIQIGSLPMCAGHFARFHHELIPRSGGQITHVSDT